MRARARVRALARLLVGSYRGPGSSNFYLDPEGDPGEHCGNRRRDIVLKDNEAKPPAYIEEECHDHEVTCSIHILVSTCEEGPGLLSELPWEDSLVPHSDHLGIQAKMLTSVRELQVKRPRICPYCPCQELDQKIKKKKVYVDSTMKPLVKLCAFHSCSFKILLLY